MSSAADALSATGDSLGVPSLQDVAINNKQINIGPLMYGLILVMLDQMRAKVVEFVARQTLIHPSAVCLNCSTVETANDVVDAFHANFSTVIAG